MTSNHRFGSKIQYRNILILGGTSGVGLASAAAFLEQGAHVIISSSQESRLDNAVTSLREAYPAQAANIAGFTCNLAGPQIENNLQTLAKQVSAYLVQQQQTKAQGQEAGSGSDSVAQPLLDHFIYTAGDHLPTVAIDDLSESTFHSALHVRVLGTLLSVKTFLPLLRKSRTSSIILTSGSIHKQPIAGGWSILSFIGAGLTGLTRQLAFDIAPIRVNCVAPGVTDTDLWADMAENDRLKMFAGFETKLLTGRVAKADDLAECYVYLVRDANVTGTVVDSNGGSFLV